MNKLLLVLSFFCLPFLLLAQEDSIQIIEGPEVKIAKHEIGLNATDFIQRLISFNDLLIDDPNAYLLTYKILLSHKRAIRFGLNANYRSARMESGINSSFPNDLKSYNFDLRVGLLMNRRLTNRWSSYLGLDVIYGSGHIESVGVNVFEPLKITRETSVLGGGPAIGIQFFLSSKISLSTELTVYYKYNEIQEKQDFDNNGFADQVSNSKTSLASIATPASLYFNFRF